MLTPCYARAVASRARSNAVRRPRRGVTLVLVAVMFTVIMGFAAMAMDFSRMYSFKAEIKTLVDASALSGVYDMAIGVNEASAESRINTLVNANSIEGHNTASITASDVTPMTWNFTTSTLSAANSWNVANAVQATARYTANYTFARTFGATTRTLSETSVAAFGSVATNNCLRPIAISYASILKKIGRPQPYDVAYNLTTADRALLMASSTEQPFNEQSEPHGSTANGFGWVDLNRTTQSNTLATRVAYALRSCMSGNIGVDSTLNGVPGIWTTVRDSVQSVCGGADWICSLTPTLLVPIFDVATGGTPACDPNQQGENDDNCDGNNGGDDNGNHGGRHGGNGNGNGDGGGPNDSHGTEARSTYTSYGTLLVANPATYHIKYIGAFKLTKQRNDTLWGVMTAITMASASSTLRTTPGPVISARIVR